MISKCSNIVINRTKFSDFEDFDVTTQSAEGLKLVGYIQSVDPATGEVTNKNVAVEYPSNEITIKRPANYFVPNLSMWEADNEIVMDTLSDGTTAYRVQAAFEGDFIQINFQETDPHYLQGTAFCECEKLGYNCFTIAFARDIPLGKTIKVLFRNFPIYIPNTAVRLIDYSKLCEDKGRVFNNGELLFHWEEKFKEMWEGKTCECGCDYTPCPCQPFNFLVTFTQTLVPNATADGASKRMMVATNIELVD